MKESFKMFDKNTVLTLIMTVFFLASLCMPFKKVVWETFLSRAKIHSPSFLSFCDEALCISMDSYLSSLF